MKKKLIILGMITALLFTGCSSKGDSTVATEQSQKDNSAEEKENALKIERQYYDKIDRGIGEVEIRSNFDNSLEILEVVYKDILIENELQSCILINYSMNNQYGNPVEDYFLWYSEQHAGVPEYKDNFEDAVKSAKGKNEELYPNRISDTHYTSDNDEHIFIVDLEDLEENE